MTSIFGWPVDGCIDRSLGVGVYIDITQFIQALGSLDGVPWGVLFVYLVLAWGQVCGIRCFVADCDNNLRAQLAGLGLQSLVLGQ
jgi:hypothetical protein